MKKSPRPHAALALAVTSILSLAASRAEAVEDLQQGWNELQKAAWFDLSQGSRVLPLSWVLALERADSTELLFSDASAAKYGLLMRDVPGKNVRLPRGLTVEQVDDSLFKSTKLRWKAWQGSNEKWLGITCGLCHTSQIDYKESSFTVYGGQTQADLIKLLFGDAFDAIKVTLSDPAKFDRFAKSVLNKDIVFLPGSGDTPENRQMLRDSLAGYLAKVGDFYDIEHVDPEKSGPGRLDAIGLIYKRMTAEAHATKPSLNSGPEAPVNYPFLWNSHQQDKVQWNGVIPNDIWLGGINIAALARNAGEVLGVFPDINVTTLPFGGMDGLLSPGYYSSLNIQNLVTLEESLYSLKAPVWPTSWPAPDPARVERGRQLYAQECAGCHTPLDRNDLTTKLKVSMGYLATHDGKPGIGTDPWMACNTVTTTANTGVMKGMYVSPFKNTGSVAPLNTLMGNRAYSADLLIAQPLQAILAQKGTVIFDTILQGPVNIAVALVQALGLSDPPFFPQTVEPNEPPTDVAARKQACLNIEDPRMAYKGRPLNGIWATAPYLHNGSVPTLYDLLLPPEERPKTFYTGSTEFDPVRVGYVSTAGGKNTFRFDTTVEGNLNGGHDYGNAQLTDEQRWDLVDYMKTL